MNLTTRTFAHSSHWLFNRRVYSSFWSLVKERVYNCSPFSLSLSSPARPRIEAQLPQWTNKPSIPHTNTPSLVLSCWEASRHKVRVAVHLPEFRQHTRPRIGISDSRRKVLVICFPCFASLYGLLQLTLTLLGAHSHSATLATQHDAISYTTSDILLLCFPAVPSSVASSLCYLSGAFPHNVLRGNPLRCCFSH